MRAAIEGSCCMPAGKLLGPNEIPGRFHGACAQGLCAVPCGSGLIEQGGDGKTFTPTWARFASIHFRAPSDRPLSP